MTGGVADGADDNMGLFGKCLVEVDAHETTSLRVVASVDTDATGGV